jgi:hypothetical protein
MISETHQITNLMAARVVDSLCIMCGKLNRVCAEKGVPILSMERLFCWSDANRSAPGF